MVWALRRTREVVNERAAWAKTGARRAEACAALVARKMLERATDIVIFGRIGVLVVGSSKEFVKGGSNSMRNLGYSKIY